MSDEQLTDDQSHYEISLTAGQAFVAFVLLLLSLAASFAFGLMIGRGQSDDRLVLRREPTVINEGSVVAAKRNDGKIVELDDFKPTATTDTTATTTTGTTATDTTATTASAPPSTLMPGPPTTTNPVVTETKLPPAKAPEPAKTTPAPAPKLPAAAPQTPVYAQLLSTADQKTAEALAAKLIDGGYTSAYVERAGTAFKVRVRFANETEARAAEGKLKAFSKDVWIVK